MLASCMCCAERRHPINSIGSPTADYVCCHRGRIASIFSISSFVTDMIESIARIPNQLLHPRRLEFLSIVMPAFREVEGIEQTIANVQRVLDAEHIDYEIVVVDDGSDDGTYSVLRQLCKRRPKIHAVRLSRHFGKEAAIVAGLRVARGQAVITMDSDLQHPPQMIPAFAAAWSNGFNVVNGVRRDRGDGGWIQRIGSRAFNLVMAKLSKLDLRGATDFKLLDREAVDTIITSLDERLRLYRGLTRWIGYEQMDIEFDVAPRVAGRSSWSSKSLTALAINGIIAHSSAPLRLITLIGLLTMMVGIGIGVDTVWSWLRHDAASGVPTIVFTNLLVSASIMISLGIIGEYVAKIYEEIKGRPHYIVADSCKSETQSPSQPSDTELVPVSFRK
jgi:glycosyltransferase involved in cell wall biosynthesis